MIKTISIFIFLILITTICYAQQISNIHFEQVGKMINIYYDLSGQDDYEIKVYCSQDGGSSWGSPLTQVTGDVGKRQESGQNKKIVWNVLSERDKLQGDVKFRVEALTMKITGTFIDSRDGKTYQWVKLGGQIWMAENMNYTPYSGSWCYYDESSNCNTYGRLYKWKTATKVCPTGWHLPSDQEWTMLADYMGGTGFAGGKMKETDTIHWNSPNTGATNESSFTALPGGYRSDNGYFYNIGNNGYFWSSSPGDAKHAWFRRLNFDYDGVYRLKLSQENGFSVRCLKDETISTDLPQ